MVYLTVNNIMLKKNILKYFPIHYYKSYISYSQEGEDMILKALYQSRKNYKGFFVDVGAHHPVRFSNTYNFYKKGWKGINIEPSPTAMGAFKLIRRRDINLNLGVASKKDILTFYCFNEPALNTFSQEIALRVNSTEKYRIIQEIKINVLPLSEILDSHVPAGIKIDFLSIDVEGLDFEVLQSNNWEKYKPEYLLIEDNVALDRIPESKVYQFLTNIGYQVIAKTLRTLIFKYPYS